MQKHLGNMSFTQALFPKEVSNDNARKSQIEVQAEIIPNLKCYNASHPDLLTSIFAKKVMLPYLTQIYNGLIMQNG